MNTNHTPDIHGHIKAAIAPVIDRADRTIWELENPHHIGRHHQLHGPGVVAIDDDAIGVEILPDLSEFHKVLSAWHKGESQ